MATFSVTDTVRKVQGTGNASTTAFAFNFQVNATSDIKVYLDSTLKSESTHYSIQDGSGNAGLAATGLGSVVFGTAPANNVVVTILSDVPLARTSVYTSGGNITAAALETDFDTITMALGDREERDTRALRAPPEDLLAVDMTLPGKTARLGTVLGFNASTGNPEAGPKIADVTTLATVTADIQTLAHIEDGTDATDTIQTVAGIASNVTTVAGVASNVTTVAGIEVEVIAVAGDATDIGVVAGKATEIGRLGTSESATALGVLGTTAAVADLAILGTTAIVEDLSLLGTSANVTAMGLLGTSAVIEDMGLLSASAVITDMDLLGTSANVTAMGILGTSANVTAMSTLSASAVVADMALLATTDVIADMALLANSDVIADMNTLATSDIVSDLNTLATSDIVADMALLATTDVVSDLNTLATTDIISDINALAVTDIVADINLLATNAVIADMASLAGSGANPNITTLTASGQIAAASLDISGDIDVDGTANLDVVDIDGAVDMASTLAVAGVVTANAGIVIDGITIDGTEIDLSTGNLNIDVANDIVLDSGDGDIQFRDTGTTFMNLYESSNNAMFYNPISDADIRFQGKDNTTVITALSLDMSEAGAATFNSTVTANAGVVVDNITIDGNEIDVSSGNLMLDVAGYIELSSDDVGGSVYFSDGGTTYGRIYNSSSNLRIKSQIGDKSISFEGVDGSNPITALTLDMSNAGAANFVGNVGIGVIPARKLHIYNTAALDVALLESTQVFSTLAFKSSSNASTVTVGIDGAGNASFTNKLSSGHIKFATASTDRVTIDNSGRVGINSVPNTSWRNDASDTVLQLGTEATLHSDANVTTELWNNAYVNNSDQYKNISTRGSSRYMQYEGNHRFFTAASASAGSTISMGERMRIDSSGNVLVGTTSTSTTASGFRVYPNDFTAITTTSSDAGDRALMLNRQSSDGTLLELRKANSILGSIGNDSNNLYVVFSNANNTGLAGGGGVADKIFPAGNTGAVRDNGVDLGYDAGRFDDIYATNATIQTSDQTEKQDIAALTSTEMLVGKRISALFKTFRWKDKVASKGDNARTHTGIIAQDVQAAFTAEGLDAGDYSLFISSTWLVDSEGNEVEEGTEDAVSKTRMGIRYPELLSFVAAYNEQRFASIEARITALEA